MSSNRRLWAVLSLWMLLCLPACALLQANPAPSAGNEFQNAVSNGLIAQVDSLEVKDTDYNLAEAVIGRLSRNYDVKVSLFSPVRRDLYFKHDGGRLKKVYVSTNNRVSKGDVLAEIVFDQESLLAEREQLMLRISQSEKQFDNDNAQRQNTLEQMKNDFRPGMSDEETELQSLRLQRQELDYRKFVYQYEQTCKAQNKQLAEIDEKLAGEQILSPYDGVIKFAFNAKENSLVRSWTKAITVEDDSIIQFALQGPIDIIRYGDVFTVTDNKELSFEARVVYDPILTDTREGQYTYVIAPTDKEAFTQMMTENNLTLQNLNSRGLVGSPLAFEADNVLIVPRNAIQPEDTKQFVYLYEDGIIKKRYVQTGLTYMDEIQILTGLQAGQLVVLN